MKKIIYVISLLCPFIFSNFSAAQTTIRVMAANTTSGNFQSYQSPGDRIFQGLDPDIVLIQEFSIFVSGGDSADQSTAVTNQWVTDNFGSDFVWYREPGNEQIPNGVISRWPFISTGEVNNPTVSNRDTAYAQIDIPGNIDLWVFSAHFLTSPASDQRAQATNIANFINANVPSGDYVIVGGDFNGTSALSNLSGVVISSAPFPDDQNGNIDTNANRNNQYDYVLASSNFASLEQTINLGNFSYPNGLVFDSRVFTPISAVPPIQTGDSGVSGMQHMAVIRDFRVNAGTTDFLVDPTTINFGTVNATNGPFNNSSVGIDVTNSFQLSSVNFSGSFSGEFSLTNPTLPATISSNTNLTFSWTPASNDNVIRNVTASFTTNGDPSSFDISLSGVPQDNGGPVGGDPIDISGWELLQTNSTQSFTFPSNTFINPGETLILVRDASQSTFESYWGISLGANVTFINSSGAFPLLNGGETYELRDDSDSNVDGPTVSLQSDENFQRNATSGNAGSAGSWTSGNDDVGGVASPGIYNGVSNRTGLVVITEFSDADTFANEFIELYYDATSIDVTFSSWEFN